MLTWSAGGDEDDSDVDVGLCVFPFAFLVCLCFFLCFLPPPPPRILSVFGLSLAVSPPAFCEFVLTDSGSFFVCRDEGNGRANSSLCCSSTFLSFSSLYICFFLLCFCPPVSFFSPLLLPLPSLGSVSGFLMIFLQFPSSFFFASPRFLLRFFLVSDSLFCCLWFWRLVAEDCEDDGQCQFSSLRFRSLVFFFSEFASPFVRSPVVFDIYRQKTLPRSPPFLPNRDGGDEQQNVNGHLHFGPWRFWKFCNQAPW